MILWRILRGYRWYYTWPAIWWHRICLWSRMVGRINQADYRTGPLLAWDVACIVHNKNDHHRAEKP